MPQMYMKKGEFAFGAGRINPMKAIELGLVYEALKEDYIKLLGRINISFFRTCRKDVKGSQKDLNYPSMQALIESGKSFTVEFSRTVTNVGPVGSTYKAKVITDSHINVSAKPSYLSFRSSGEKKSFCCDSVWERIANKNKGICINHEVRWHP